MMKRNIITLIFAFNLLVVSGVLWITSYVSLIDAQASSEWQDSTPIPTPTVDRLAEPTLPASPSQADLGAVDYWLSCMVCHGDRGQGLTEEWREVSGPTEKNCWQSKCHAPNHPPEGFVLPRYAPRIIGPGSLARFETAADLHAFISENMPWQMPGMLEQDRYWRLTAFLIQANDLNLGSEPLNPQTAAQVNLHTKPVLIEPTQVTPNDGRFPVSINRQWLDLKHPNSWLLITGAAVLIIALLALILKNIRQ